jgi:V-type H+-transporting ATPase subunit E
VFCFIFLGLTFVCEKQRVKVIRVEAEIRVEKMRVREARLEEVKFEAVEALQGVTADEMKYENMLCDLIVQGLIKLNEPVVQLVVRECDIDITKKVLSRASGKYRDIMKKSVGKTVPCSLSINRAGKCLQPPSDGSGKASCAGGVKLLAAGGKIVCDNTLDARLETSIQELMPEIRSALFSQRM